MPTEIITSRQVTGTSTTSVIYSLTTLTANTGYQLKFPTTNAGKSLVTANATADNIDSDALPSGIVAFSTASFGANDHTFDVGYGTAPTDVAIVKSTSSSSVTLGSPVTFSLNVTNNGSPASSVIVRDTLATGVTYLSSIPAATTSLSGSKTVLTWNLGTIADGGSSAISLVVKADVEGVSFNTAWVITTSAESTTINNVSRACYTVPMPLCVGKTITASLPTSYSNVQWFKDGVLVGSGNSYTITAIGSYSYTSTNGTCPTGGCCPILVVPSNLATVALNPPGLCDSQTTSYSLSGTISLTNVSAGNLTITDGTVTATVAVSAGQSSATLSLTGLLSDETSHTVTVSLPGCGTATATYNAPASCTVAASILVTSTTVCYGTSATLVASGCTGTVSWSDGSTGLVW